MFELDHCHKCAILVYVLDEDKRDEDWNFREFLSLASASRIKVVDVLVIRNVIFNAQYLIGKGKVIELQHMLQNSSATVVLFNNILSPRQEYNLKILLKLKYKIIDRNQLILDIFSRRARTYEGRLQVQLAQLRYLNSRLIHEWSHLERQTGGIGVRGGPGEMQLESDRRLLRKKITQVLLRLKKIENQRNQNRRHRVKIGIPIVSLVGYTNAGKSTLFNVMTESHVYVTKQLFSTLDPIFRRVVYKKKSNFLLADTVGFIQNFPKSLIISFRATLQEIIQATLLLHVVDISHEEFHKKMNIVKSTLHHIQANNIPILLVMNKIDQLNNESPHIDRDNNGVPTKVWLSAKNRKGISLLLQAIEEILLCDMIRCELVVPINDDVYQILYRLQVVEQCQINCDNNVRLTIYISSIHWFRLLKQNKSLSRYVISYP